MPLPVVAALVHCAAPGAANGGGDVQTGKFAHREQVQFLAMLAEPRGVARARTAVALAIVRAVRGTCASRRRRGQLDDWGEEEEV